MPGAAPSQLENGSDGPAGTSSVAGAPSEMAGSCFERKVGVWLLISPQEEHAFIPSRPCGHSRPEGGRTQARVGAGRRVQRSAGASRPSETRTPSSAVTPGNQCASDSGLCDDNKPPDLCDLPHGGLCPTQASCGPNSERRAVFHGVTQGSGRVPAVLRPQKEVCLAAPAEGALQLVLGPCL